MNRIFLISCILSVAVDPLFYYLPLRDDKNSCLGIDRRLAVVCTTLRTVLDSIYIIRIALQFRTAYIAPSSQVFVRGALDDIDPKIIAKRYFSTYFIVDLLAVLPLPQIVIWNFLLKLDGSDIYITKKAVFVVVIIQNIPRFCRLFPLRSDENSPASFFTENSWVCASYYLLWFMLLCHIAGSFWYFLSVEREDDCWHLFCAKETGCDTDFLYCGNRYLDSYEYDQWFLTSRQYLTCQCNATNFRFGIYEQAVKANISASSNFISKLFYCLYWGMRNLSTLGQGLRTTTYPGEVSFSMALAIVGLICMQSYFQSVAVRQEEMRNRRRDSEQWMNRRMLPQSIRERVREYDQYKWLETQGVDEEGLIQNLPNDLRRDIKRHLCLSLVRRVPLFTNLDERLLDTICEHLKPVVYTRETYILREGDPVEEMLFISHGCLESSSTYGERSGCFNKGFLKKGDFCGEELLPWALNKKFGAKLPSSTRTLKTLEEVEVFALKAEELKFVVSQSMGLKSKQAQHMFRYYSRQWRTWAAIFIQTAWRHYTRRKLADLQRKEEEAALKKMSGDTSSLRATIFASQFIDNALLGVHRRRNVSYRDTLDDLIK